MITLLTDFGTSDYFVPVIKGVILSINPGVLIVDLTHDIAAQDVEAAAFTLGACYRDFPAGTIHLAIVDPGVGSTRRPILLEAGGQLFVGPDNGIFSFIYVREPDVRVFQITRDELFRHPVSATFHGRDLFAPVAAHLSLAGTDFSLFHHGNRLQSLPTFLKPETLGPEIRDYIRFDIAKPRESSQGRLLGCLIHIDRFGNCITNFTEHDIRLDQAGHSATMTIAGHRITQFGTHFAEAEKKDRLLAYPGSAGYWEIGLWCASAAELIGARRGIEVLFDCG